jgi:hypothetical protein
LVYRNIELTKRSKIMEEAIAGLLDISRAEATARYNLQATTAHNTEAEGSRNALAVESGRAADAARAHDEALRAVTRPLHHNNDQQMSENAPRATVPHEARRTPVMMTDTIEARTASPVPRADSARGGSTAQPQQQSPQPRMAVSGMRRSRSGNPADPACDNDTPAPAPQPRRRVHAPIDLVQAAAFYAELAALAEQGKELVGHPPFFSPRPTNL